MATERLRSSYEAVAVTQTDQVLGVTGGVGDVLETLVVSVATAATGTCSIKDGSGSAIVITAANTPIGVYPIRFGKDGIKSTGGAWKVTTGDGATALAIGRFTP